MNRNTSASTLAAALTLAVVVDATGHDHHSPTAASDPTLFHSPSPDFETPAPSPFGLTVLRARAMQLDVAEALRSLNTPVELTLNLFLDTELRASVREARPTSQGGTLVAASLADGGRMTLMITEGGIVRGEIHSPQGTFLIRSGVSDRSHVTIEEVDISTPRLFHRDDVQIVDPVFLEQLPTRLRERGQADQCIDELCMHEAPTVDLLVLYTTGIADLFGNKEEIEATIVFEVEKTNEVLRDSGLAHRQIRLVATQEVEYKQDSLRSLQGDLAALHRRGDGLLDDVHNLRRQVGADLVHLVVQRIVRPDFSKWGFFVGVGQTYRRSSDQWAIEHCEQHSPESVNACVADTRLAIWSGSSSFSVSTAIPLYYTLAHELGHNMGLFHDRYEQRERLDLDSGEFPHKPFGFGYVNQDFSESHCYYTVMAYRNQCQDEGTSSPVYVSHFSNPALEFQSGDRAGTAGSHRTTDLDGPANAARAIDEIWDDILTRLMPSALSCREGAFRDLRDQHGTLVSSTMRVSASGASQTLELSNIPFYCTDGVSIRGSGFVSPHVALDARSRYVIDLLIEKNDLCLRRQGELTLRGPAGAKRVVSIVQDPGPDEAGRRRGNLNLSDQGIVELNECLFSHASGVRKLNLERNKLTRLTAGSFAGMPGLVDLELSGNDIQTVSDGAFGGLTSLELLDLSHNAIQVLGSGTFSGLWNLQVLDLGYNRIREIRSGVFSHFGELIRLDLSGNDISAIDPESFSGLPRLVRLYLSENRFDTVDRRLLEGLTSLFELDLSNVGLRNIASGTFSGNPALKYLFLDNNDVRRIAPSPFFGVNLDGLSIEYRGLGDVPRGIFADVPNIRYLWIQSHDLSRWPDGVFLDLRQLWYFNLSYDRLGRPLSAQTCRFFGGVKFLIVNGRLGALDELCPGTVAGPADTSDGRHGDAPAPDGSVLRRLYRDQLDVSTVSRIADVSEHRVLEAIAAARSN